jgi:hypothetical protein
MTLRKVTLSRTELYEKVWTEPIAKLAPRYGLSDVGLAKICKRNKIPRPPRGYWAKKQFGNAPRRTPLPKKDHDPVIEINGYPFQTCHPKIQELIIGQVALKKKHDRKILVPEQMASPHPLVIRTAEILNSTKPDRTGKLQSPWGKCLDIEATPRDFRNAWTRKPVRNETSGIVRRQRPFHGNGRRRRFQFAMDDIWRCGELARSYGL